MRKNILNLSGKRYIEVYEYALKRKWTWKKFKRYYRQPPWCNYPDALIGDMGCWALTQAYYMNDEYKKNLYKNKCSTCDCSKYYNKKLIIGK